MATHQQETEHVVLGWLDRNWVEYVQNCCGTGGNPHVYMAVGQAQEEEKKEEVKN